MIRQATDTANKPGTFNLDGNNDDPLETTEVNAAFVGFEYWAAPLIEQSSITIALPDGFEQDVNIGNQLWTQRDEVSNEWLLTRTDIAPDDFFWGYANLHHDAALQSSTVTFNDHSVEVRSWPGDEAWGKIVSGQIEDGLPVMIDQIGLEWPANTNLEVVESATPSLSGYGGWHLVQDHKI